MNVMVRKLVGEVVENVISEIKARQELLALSPYEKVRNERVAEIRSEFDRQFPNHWKEMKELRLGLKVVKKKKTVTFLPPMRKSSRIRDTIWPQETEKEVTRSSDVELPHEVDESGRGQGQVEEVPLGAQDGEGGEATEIVLESLVESSAGVDGRFACQPCNKAFR